MGTLTEMRTDDVEVGQDQAVVYDVYVGGGPAVAQASLSNFNNTSGASAWVGWVDDTEYFYNTVYSADMHRVTFGVVSLYSEGDFGDDWAAAVLNVFKFGVGAKVLATQPPPPPPYYDFEY